MKMAGQMLKVSAIALTFGLVPVVAQAQNLMGVSVTETGDTAVSQTVRLGLNKSIVIDLTRPAADVVITNPRIADAVVQTAQRIIFRGIEAGQTNAFIFDRNGNHLLSLEIIVDIDTAALDGYIAKYVPDARVNVETINGSIVITGTVDSLVQSDQVIRLVEAYAGDNGEGGVLNMMTIAAKDQVMLEVRIVEMQRTVVKQLGINLSGTTNFGDLASRVVDQLRDATGAGIFFDPDVRQLITDAAGNTSIVTLPGIGSNVLGVGNPIEGFIPAAPFGNQFGISSSNGFNVAGSSLGGLSTNVGYTNFVGDIPQSSAGAAIDALERVGIVRTLAEPNIMAVSGETAKFLAGGEYPVPIGQDQNGQISIQFKPYGVGLAFTPIVLSEGRISLKVSTEISELTSVGAFQGQTSTFTDAAGNTTTSQSLTIPALTVRRAESTVELPSGGSTMLAGLIQSQSRQTIDQLPGIKKLPILGALFQSRDFQNQETELVVIITPYLVDPTRKDELRTPADGYVNASDTKTIFFGKLNAMYAEPGKGISPETYNAPVGFIEE